MPTAPRGLGGAVEKDGGERLYFVVETKSGLFAAELRYRERAKIEYGKAHFSALAVGESPAQYIVAKDSNDLFA
jgi:type III restriction enzyme